MGGGPGYAQSNEAIFWGVNLLALDDQLILAILIYLCLPYIRDAIGLNLPVSRYGQLRRGRGVMPIRMKKYFGKFMSRTLAV